MRAPNVSPSAGLARQRVWDAAQRRRGGISPWASQSGQDRWLDEEVFVGMRGGRFLDLGGFDGLTGSNSLFFERHRGWSGLLVEPVPQVCAKARAVRRCACLPVAVGAADGTAPLRVVTAGRIQTTALVETFCARMLAAVRSDPRHAEEIIDVEVRTVASLLDEHGIDRLDYVSIDVEGAEPAVLDGFPLDRVRVGAWTIENLTGGDEIRTLLTGHGYDLVHRVGMDDVYVDGGCDGRGGGASR